VGIQRIRTISYGLNLANEIRIQEEQEKKRKKVTSRGDGGEKVRKKFPSGDNRAS